MRVEAKSEGSISEGSESGSESESETSSIRACCDIFAVGIPVLRAWS